MKSTYFNTYSLSIIILFSNGLNGSYILIHLEVRFLEIIMFLAVTYFFDIVKILKTLMIFTQ